MMPFMAARLGAGQGRAITAGEWGLGAESVRLGVSACADVSLVEMRQMSNVGLRCPNDLEFCHDILPCKNA
jgi:hypothetical protein